MKYAVAGMLCAGLVAGCSGLVPGSGMTQMNPGSAVELGVSARATDMVRRSVRNRGCAQVDEITPTTLDTTPDFAPRPAYVASGGVRERWVARGCGRDFVFLVEFWANGRGGTNIKFDDSLVR